MKFLSLILLLSAAALAASKSTVVKEQKVIAPSGVNQELQDLGRSKRLAPLALFLPTALILAGIGEIADRSRWFRDIKEIKRPDSYRNLKKQEFRKTPIRDERRKKIIC
ncbi:unnamed protein product [Allacma fusca]|uniref:Uncharacterized protein n=1 Tax=Allacma fusca TaxID=39272 RepID=A0A8J2L6V0_9HEXA|nr:unnamed protein product [Allacma fusca]